MGEEVYIYSFSVFWLIREKIGNDRGRAAVTGTSIELKRDSYPLIPPLPSPLPPHTNQKQWKSFWK